MTSSHIKRRSLLAVGATLTISELLSGCHENSTKSGSGSPEPQHSPTEKATVHHIVVLSTGGTIASTHDSKGAVVPTVSGEELVKPVYDAFPKGTLHLEVQKIAQLDSSAMTLDDTDHIIQAVLRALGRAEVSGVIVTHGTDSMEETAIALDTFVSGNKPVVLTGAMRPHDDPHPDGPSNLTLAVRTATDARNRGKGVFVAFGGKVFHARGLHKADTQKEDGFATNCPHGVKRPAPLPFKPLRDVRVDIIAAYPGAPATLIDSSIDNGAQGLVIEGMGDGNIGSTFADAAVRAATRHHVPVVLTTRVDAGQVAGVYGGAGGGATLAEKGIISSGPLRAGQSRILVAAALATGTDPRKLF
ncbi:asparaginase [Cutibacterium granulosum]|uniref:asparaginase n=1 Tax=Cutibacterium granulosum TaxID=33011 RepID=UPI002B22EB06|nr:asparaginase [Cutibacterium granulosum]MEA5650178.1 asparaginase [Cutibacterium granulosum]